jgi:mycofactocin system glycosyltransferase
VTSPADPSLPEGRLSAELHVSLTPGVHVLDEGRVLVGGQPLRALSLTARGAEVVSGWRAPGAIGAGSARHDLARRLMDAGMLELHPPARVAIEQLTFVVPVRDRPEQLERCLRALVSAAPEARVIVVDDGSVTPVRSFGAHAVRVIRHPEVRGPAAARNTGLEACFTAFVGFVDSDVVLPDGAAGRLLGHFADPCLAAVAPRVRALGARGPIAAYEARHSALDMGPNGGLVAPGRPISYVPSTVLFVRRSAIDRGFDEDLPIGEDVDLVWRLHAAGWRVRYVPDVEVMHEHPARLAQLVARRYVYACSVGLLARRHPSALPAVWITPAAALAWSLAIGGRRTWSAAVVTWSVARTGRRLRAVTPMSRRLAVAVALRGFGHSAAGLSRAVRRAWSPPLLVIACRSERARAVLATAFAARILEDALVTADARASLGDAPLRILDEAIAAVGTWDGCIRSRTLRPLLPSFTPPGSARATRPG